jgi:hypothetical protein
MLLSASNQPAHPDGKELISRFLEGERVTVGDLRYYGVSGVKDPLSARNSEHVLKTVLTGLRHFGVRGTILLFDENEKTLHFNRYYPPRRVVMGANLLRRLIDGAVGGVFPSSLCVFAVLPGFVENCALAYPALGQRLHILRDTGRSVGWRSPVLPVEDTTSIQDADAFVDALARRLEQVARRHSPSLSDGLGERLKTVGRQIVQTNAGSGYKRQVIRTMATLTCTALETGGKNGA